MIDILFFGTFIPLHSELFHRTEFVMVESKGMFGPSTPKFLADILDSLVTVIGFQKVVKNDTLFKQ